MTKKYENLSDALSGRIEKCNNCPCDIVVIFEPSLITGKGLIGHQKGSGEKPISNCLCGCNNPELKEVES